MTTATAFSEQSFRTPEEFEGYFGARSRSRSMCDVTPISSNGFWARAEIVTNPKLRVEHAKWSSLTVDGVVSDDSFTFAHFLRSSERNSVWRRTIGSNDLAWTAPGRDRRGHYPGEVDVIAITAPLEFVLSKSEERGLNVQDRLLAKEAKVRASGRMAAQLVSTVGALMQACRLNSPAPLPQRVMDYAAEKLFDTFLDAISEVDGIRQFPRDEIRSHEIIVRKAEDLVRGNRYRIWGVNQIADAVGVSRQTLHRAFIDLLGISVGQYVKNWRLTCARRDLVELKFVKVTDCAVAWGFYDVGRFAGYYRSLFRELPSETISRSLGVRCDP